MKLWQLIVMILAPAMAVAQSNDNLTNAQLLGGNNGTISINNSSASGEVCDPFLFGGDGQTVWYEYRPVGEGLLSLDVSNSPAPALVGIIRASDGCNPPLLNSDLRTPEVCVENGETYRIIVDSSSGAGLLRVDWEYITQFVAPANFNVSQETLTTGVQISWDPTPAAESYRIYRGTSGAIAAAELLISGLEATSYLDQTTEPGVRYFYFVQAVRGCLEGAISVGASGARGCALTTSVERLDVNGEGGQAAFILENNGGCFWEVSTDSDWIELQTSQGTGDGEVSFFYQENDTALVRNAIIRVETTASIVNFAVIQQAGECIYQFSPNPLRIPWDGGSGTVDVMAGEGCPWSASDSSQWIAPFGAGEGDGQFTYTAEMNLTGQQRQGFITVAGENLTVIQDMTPPCNYNISPVSLDFPCEGGGLNLNITPNRTGCPFTVTSNAPWISGLPSGELTDPITLTITAQENPTTGTLTGEIIAAGRTIPITQAGCPLDCTAVFDPDPIIMPPFEDTLTVTFTIDGRCDWTIEALEPWLFITATSNNGAGGQITIGVRENTGKGGRTGRLLISGEGYEQVQFVTQQSLADLVIDQLLGKEKREINEVNGDGRVDAADVRTLTH